MSITSISGGSNHNVTVYGSGTVMAGNGNDSVSIGYNGTVLIGNGNDTINVMAGTASINAGSGNDQIMVNGTGVVSVGGGHDTIAVTRSAQITESGTSGQDTINLGRGSDTIITQGQATVYGAFQGGSPIAGLANNAYLPFQYGAAGSATISGGQLITSHSGSVSQYFAVNGHITLLGGAAPMEFIGGSGSTVMKGASGSDTFVGGSGHDTMTGVGNHNVFDFVASAQGGQHVITNFVSGDQLNVEGNSLSYLIANNEVTNHGGNTYISIDGGKTTIELQGINMTGVPVNPVHDPRPVFDVRNPDDHKPLF